MEHESAGLGNVYQVTTNEALSGGSIVNQVQREFDGDAGSLNERLYAAHDTNFNTTALIDTSGNVVERFAYDPYGPATNFSNTSSTRANSNYAWNYLHQGGRLDTDSG